MKYGFISDIHGNYEGLRIAVFHLKKLGCEIVCLGDIVSENSDDNEHCIQLIKKLNIQTVKGQHDDTCVKCDSPPVSQTARSYLESFPEMMAHRNILCVHDNPLEKARSGQGMWRNGSYIRSQTEATVVSEEFFNSQSDFQYVFIGHTHTPNVFSGSNDLQIAYNRPIQLNSDIPYIINPGNIGGAQRDIETIYSYLCFDQGKNQLTFFRVEHEGLEFVKNNMVKGGKNTVTVQKNIFSAYSQKRIDTSTILGAEIKSGTDKSAIFSVTKNLSVCGYSGILSREHLKNYEFNAHFQCTTGFEEWLDTIVEVKSLPFEDYAPISSHILVAAYDWLGHHWELGNNILISCADGGSRSVSIAIGLLTLKSGLSFMEACEKVFLSMPEAYPHPKPLVSVAQYCGHRLDLDQLRMIYGNASVPPPFPWKESEFIDSLQ